MKKKPLKDIQAGPDIRRIPIDKVGVKDIRYPIVVLDKKNKYQHTIASIGMYVDLPHQFKGTHMSRFIEILNEHRREITVKNFPEILRKMKQRFNASIAHLELEFPYFIEKTAPVSRSKGLMEYKCGYTGRLSADGLKDFVLEVAVPVTTLCPCSKEISERGAHNQRGTVRVALRFKGFVWIEDIVRSIESSASAPVYSLLKRDDEKHVTEAAYDRPMFVEDVVREVALKLERLKKISWARIEAENYESIHNHSAYASIERSF
ncbi:MAG: GTP cyclohydrolase I FolE2 [Deltaproteobacteria bacterium]|nr:GTP cyclohydrolase I FolE2 [Deltaproteobacteria bacterium]